MRTAKMYSIEFASEVAFINYLDKVEHYLVRADKLENDKEHQSQITQICNQSLVYESLFQKPLEGAVYTNSNAEEFLNWAHQGWSQKTHFVFFVLSKFGRIVGALDIKSANLNNAEIGYWADSEYPGNITNALIALLEQATKTGFSKFTAFVLRENLSSSRVLMRSGFEESSNSDRKGYLRYEKNV